MRELAGNAHYFLEGSQLKSLNVNHFYYIYAILQLSTSIAIRVAYCIFYIFPSFSS